VPLDNLGADYDVADLLPKIRDAVSVGGKLYAAPFYGESSMVMYRTDLFQKAGLTMPEKPSWDFVIDAANKLTDKAGGVYGICLRGKAGWGENMAFLTAMANSYGARWFDEKWQPQFDKPEWKKTLTTYVDLMKAAGPPGGLDGDGPQPVDHLRRCAVLGQPLGQGRPAQLDLVGAVRPVARGVQRHGRERPGAGGQVVQEVESHVHPLRRSTTLRYPGAARENVEGSEQGLVVGFARRGRG